MTSFSVQLKNPYRSLVPFSWSEIPALTVITGTSGTGKSHLLEMIARSCGAVGDKLGNSPDQEVDAVVEGIQTGSGKVLYVRADQAVDFSEEVTLEDVEKRINELYMQPTSDTRRGAAWRAVRSLYDDFFVPEDSDRGQDRKLIRKPPISEFRRRLTASIVTRTHMRGRSPNLAMLFFTHALLHANLVASGKTSAEADAQLNPPPWESLDEIFRVAGLHLRCVPPQVPEPSIFHQERKFVLQFRDSRTGQPVTPNTLSSGEKALCSLLFLEYTTSLEASQYALILLDEPDAHLHPDFVKRFFRVVEKIVARRCRVMLTTHSPTTVALAPEDALFVMKDPGAGAPQSTSRSDALARLLDGVPAVSVISRNNRQIFVESQYDAEIYAEIYGILRKARPDRPAFLSSEVALSFVSSGTGGAGSCEQVTKIVGELRENPFVSGLIDWDRKATPIGRVEVLGRDERYSIENFLFDPVVLGAFLLHHQHIREIGGMNFSTEVAIANRDAHEAIAKEVSQKMIDRLNQFSVDSRNEQGEGAEKIEECLKECAEVLNVHGGRYSSNGEMIEVSYCSGQKARIPKWLLQLRGHNLEDLVIFTFPMLKPFAKRQNSLKMTIIKQVLAPHPDLIPSGFLHALTALQRASGSIS